MNDLVMQQSEQPPVLTNWIAGSAEKSSSTYHQPVTSPLTGETIAFVPFASSKELELAIVQADYAAQPWAAMTYKERMPVFLRMRQLLEINSRVLAAVIHRESGKPMEEALQELQRCCDSLDHAISLPQQLLSRAMSLTHAVEALEKREPLGVVAGITPFNFPALAPMWLASLALLLGNAFVLKPSELTPMTALELAKLWQQAGLPAGLFTVIQGGKDIVEVMAQHTELQALAFIGSTPVAKAVYKLAAKTGKRVRALGGAKNFCTILQDADERCFIDGVVKSFISMSGQLCTTPSVLVAVGGASQFIDKLVQKLAAVKIGIEMGPVISEASLINLRGYLTRAEAEGASLRLDGREAKLYANVGGFYIGPSVLDNASIDHECAREEILGPILTVMRCDSLSEAIELQQQSFFANTASLYTKSPAAAQHFLNHVQAGMVGINVAMPAARQPFSYGGWKNSLFGDGDITGDDAVRFWSRVKKVAVKWQ